MEGQMNRLNQILVGLLVVQLVVVGILFWPRSTASVEGQSLFPDVTSDRIVGLTITGPDGQTLHLAKLNGQWVLPEAEDYPVLEDKVPTLLDKIIGLKAERLVTQTAASHERLKVAADSYERLVEFELSDGTRYRLYLGSSPSYSATHVRADGQDEVYLASNLSAQDAGVAATNWVDQAYLSIPRDQITTLTLENKNGRFEFEKSGDAWTMKGLAEGETLNQTSVEALVSRAASVTLTKPLGKVEQQSYGLQQPGAVVTIRTHTDEAGDRTFTLRVGARDPADNSYVVISSESPYYVRVAEFSVKDFVEKARDGFLQLPPTPTAEATPVSP
jgi:hypothetical protein